jgi:hypothetical protein
VFDPDEYTKANQPMTLDRHRLTEDELRSWAGRLTQLRRDIEQKAERFASQEAAELFIDANPRSRRGHKRSKAEHNAEGLKEEELRELRIIDSAPCRRYKKRRLRELSDEEVAEIIADSQRPGWLKKDIAQKYRVTPDLVSKLCKEAAQQPEKMTARRQLKQVLAEKTEAIAEVTTNILKTGTPIVRA